ncbi:MAG: HEAT repeat domain-containing protein [Planctomycetaceae bacterium]|nr:HEAT repeat domain-containing protein [Planctomycetaceae bacterium]
MSKLCNLTVAALSLALLSSPAMSQVESDEPGHAPDVRIEPAAPVGQPTVEELLQRLDALEAEMAAPAAARDRGLALMLASSHLASTNYFGEGGVRYFVTGLILINLTDEPVTIPTSGVVLEADGQKLQLADAEAQLSRHVLQFGNGQLGRYTPLAESIIIAGHGSTSTTLFFAGIDSATPVPALRLIVNWERGSETLDVNAYQRGVLGLEVERLGPHNCGALLTINGELNTVNAAALADELDVLAADGAVRTAVAWGATAPRPDDQLLGWLAVASSEDQGLQYSQLPRIPAAVRETFHLVQPPGSDAEPYGGYITTPMHATVDGAMIAALRTAYESVPREELRAELAQGHRLSRAAALAYSGSRLGRRELPLVLAASESDDGFVRQQALVALSQYGESQAIERLVKAGSSADPVMMQTAIASLAGSRYPAAQAALRTLLDKLDPAQTVGVIDVLARFPRNEWVDRIALYYQSGDQPLRLAALRALVRLGHADIVSLLETALNSGEPELRTFAYVQLSLRTDPRSEGLASSYALKLLETSPPDSNTHSLLMRTRDQRALPALLKHLDASGGGRESLIVLIAQVGGVDAFPDLLARYPRLTSQEKAAVLEILLAGKSDGIRPLALEALTSGDSQLADVASRIVAAQPDEHTVPALAEALRKSQSPEAWAAICTALGNIGDRAAREALLAARRTDDLNLRVQAVAGLSRIKSSSPAYQFSHLVEQALEEGRQQRALKLLDLQILFDPEYAEAYARRGHVRLQQQRLAEALADFERAEEFDPFDSFALTGRAIVLVMQGQTAEGVRRVRDAADQFPGDEGFEYNAACVYARAFAQLQDGTSPADVAVRKEYLADALKHIRHAMLLGFTSEEYYRNDPDLAVLKGVEEFESLLANPPQMETDEDAGDLELGPGNLR